MARYYYGECSFSGCDGRSVNKANMLCSGHYTQRQRGLPEGQLKDRNGGKGECSFTSCGWPAKTKGLCGAHYAVHMRGGELVPIRRRTVEPIGEIKETAEQRQDRRAAMSCRFDGCSNVVSHVSTSLCQTHQSQMIRTGVLKPIDHGRSDRSIWIPCPRSGCESTMNPARDLCHYCQETANRFGLSADEYLGLYVNGVQCAACGQPGVRMSIDHDHACCNMSSKSCGKCVRGLLCHHCNVILGMAKDNPLVLTQLVGYLSRNNPA